MSGGLERAVIYIALAIATVAAWTATFLSVDGSVLDPFLVRAFCGADWGFGGAAATFAMWNTMMVAMMLPASAPTIDAFATIASRRRARREPYTPVLVFCVGFLAVWGCFSVLATGVQWQLYRAALLTPDMRNTSLTLAGCALLLAGGYQFTPLKNACLHVCRSPLSFILIEWREGYRGALLMGLRHGLSCTGCCWALMGLMFCVSVMDLRWAAALSIYGAIEKLSPRGDLIAVIFGVAASMAGLAVIVLGIFA